MSQKKKNYEFNKQTPAAPPAVKKVETDEILDGSDKFQYLLSQHWKKIAIGFGVLALIVITLLIVKYVREYNDIELRREFAAAKTTAELQALVDKHADHPSAIPALFRLGDLYAKEKDFAKAAETFKRIYDAQENVNDFDRLRGGIASAYQLEAAGKQKEAIALFTAVAQDQTVQEYPMVMQEAIYGAARLLSASNDNAGALALLDKIPQSENTANSYWQMQCKKLKAQLAEKK